ncbi:hypothetical protein A9Q84_07960 [Halobacteriovorax marinus]|uniref:Lipoprotein n=1 Tax=Halobacteriovorax marinus TaxID=97084 RepID=A0A1Y5F5W6_9BACT|nr:hypothetical protein A9Q84_07960 [Halobacteriovorax marinus]
MSRKLFFMFILLGLSSCQRSSQISIDQFCSDLNILLIQRNVVTSNILNISTTRTESGGPYIPQMVTNCSDVKCDIKPLTCTGIGCSRVNKKREPILKYQPNHPDSMKNGYVAYPDINLAEEKLKLDKIELAINYLMKSMPMKYDFFFSKESKKYFTKYPMLNHQMNFRKLIKTGR